MTYFFDLVMLDKTNNTLSALHKNINTGSSVIIIYIVFSSPGHCHDANTGQPPRGLQFTLGHMSDVVMDTIVMANLVS